MTKLLITFTDRDQRNVECQSWKFDQSQLVLEYGDLSEEWINRNNIRSVRIWKDDIPV